MPGNSDGLCRGILKTSIKSARTNTQKARINHGMWRPVGPGPFEIRPRTPPSYYWFGSSPSFLIFDVLEIID
jgi:hypothetical protein